MLARCGHSAEQLPHHRGSGASRVQGKINSVGLLSEYLRRRPDHGLSPTALGRCDVEGFLNRLAYLESTDKISRYHRNLVCREVWAVLAGIRGLGLTRTGKAAAGLAGDFAIERRDIPADPVRGEPGRNLPPEIMATLCANLDTLERHCCIKRSAHLTWSTCLPRSHAAGLEYPVCYDSPRCLRGLPLHFGGWRGRPSP
jgi:hypothetical protein